jgi:hypothetical protein
LGIASGVDLPVFPNHPSQPRGRVAAAAVVFLSPSSEDTGLLFKIRISICGFVVVVVVVVVVVHTLPIQWLFIIYMLRKLYV